MPILEKIVIQDFRNIELQELEFSPKINCIGGGNGEGKTNLLEAVWYLSMTKSALGRQDRYNFRKGTEAFSLLGSYLMPSGLRSRISVSVSSNGEKKLKRDEKVCERISDHIGLLPVVMVSPSDTSLVSESGEERRRFVNSVLSQLDREYLSSLQQYNKLLMQRNRLLKEGYMDEDYLDTLDRRLEDLATPVYMRREAFCRDLLPLAAECYERISAGGESIGMEYRSDLSKGSLYDMLRAGRERDRVLKYTGAGIQRDDFVFTLDGMPLRRCGSQGQQKSFLVALKFSQYGIMKDSCGFAPTLLLDDLFDKLDPGRISRLLRMVSDDDFGQIFITDSDKVRTANILDALGSDRACFEAKGGVFSRL